MFPHFVRCFLIAFIISDIVISESYPQAVENLWKNNLWFMVGNCGELCNFEAKL